MGFLFGGGGSQRREAPARMPASNDVMAQQARARTRQNIFTRTGRSSTIQTTRDPANPVSPGVASFTNSLLGSA